ncbi:hypothetical protein DL95DRAFT_443881 [Leptodontidium sp. 2 PMI_412]|nr:hypothetical protein DL95DRAFT_443881 [Leptodontidium sp. 2 PMI_412]
MSFIFITTFLYLYINIVAAQTHSATGNSTATDTSKDRIGWKSSPDGRSTMDIIWSCASVLLVCTYKCLHLNISSFEENQAGWRRTKRWGVPYRPEWLMIRKHLRKIKWMALVLIVPEIGVAIACCQYMNARAEVWKARLEFRGEELTLTHGFYAVASGFAVTSGRSQEGSMEGRQEEFKSSERNREELYRSDLTTYGTYIQSTPPKHPNVVDNLVSLNGNTNYLIVKLCKEQNSPIITEDDISDRSKSDFFTKTFAIVQSTWLVIQSIARVSAGLPISELELATTAYVLCTIVMYGFWWHKPFDVEHVTIVQGRGADPSEAWKKRPEIVSRDALSLLDFTFDRAGGERNIRTIIVNTIATLFSAIHLAAWNWEFPRPVSRTLWRIFGITSTASGPLAMSLTFLAAYSEDVLEMIGSTSLQNMIVIFVLILVGMVLVVYTISRIGLIVLVFYTFSSLPAAVYETIEWTTYLPHFS